MAAIGLLFLLGLFCLIGTIITLIFTIISFANNKSRKFVWLTFLLISILGLVISITIIVKTTITKVENFATQTAQNFENYADNLSKQMSDSLTLGQTANLTNNEQVKKIKNFDIENGNLTASEQFYSYLGFGNYYRYPLTFPYSVHCNLFKDNGELFNEENVVRFDENDNDEQTTHIENIQKIAFDNKWLLIEYMAELRETNKTELRFVLFSFIDEKRIYCKSLNELFIKAKNNGYKGDSKLMSISDYDALFK